MPIVWHRSPRYLLLLLIVLSVTLYSLLHWQHSVPLYAYPPKDNDLLSKLARAERTYSWMLRERQAMIRKFGPNPSDVVMFPPDKKPWPAYTVWDFFPAVFDCPFELERIGDMGDGGKWFCGLSRIETKPDCVVYTIGMNFGVSFERAVLDRTHCRIWAYDHTIRRFAVPLAQQHRTHFRRYELVAADSKGSAARKTRYTLDELMRLNAHTHIDVLKIDVEGNEFITFTSLLQQYIAAKKVLPFGQLLLEIHLWTKTFPEVLELWALMEAAGLRPFRSEPNLVYQNYNRQSGAELAEYSFINIHGNNIFILDPRVPIFDSVTPTTPLNEPTMPNDARLMDDTVAG